MSKYSTSKAFFTKILTLVLLISLCILSCGDSSSKDNNDDSDKSLKTEEIEQVEVIPEQTEPLTFNDIIGQWSLMYPNNLGYEFQFYKNYRALIVLYLGNHSLLFKGVYNIEEENKVRINIYEMKRSTGVRGINKTSGFLKAKSSYFLLRCYTAKQNNTTTLIMRPISIMIDGQNSDGYLEPVLRLKKAK